MHLPHTELVARAWLQGIEGLPDNAVGTTLPADQTAWPLGFLEVMVVGGTPDRDIPERRPTVQVDAWAANPRAAKPPWGRANQLAEIVYQACFDHASMSRQVILPGEYAAAYVQSVYPLSEPRRLDSDVARYAHYSVDLAFIWKAVS